MSGFFTNFEFSFLQKKYTLQKQTLKKLARNKHIVFCSKLIAYNCNWRWKNEI
ncbi:MAG: hypothetical protein ACI936_004272 [Paraglaciecola sp.]|jgi:hypothetical protein